MLCTKDGFLRTLVYVFPFGSWEEINVDIFARHSKVRSLLELSAKASADRLQYVDQLIVLYNLIDSLPPYHRLLIAFSELNRDTEVIGVVRSANSRYPHPLELTMILKEGSLRLWQRV
jgi:hypothetical protein